MGDATMLNVHQRPSRAVAAGVLGFVAACLVASVLVASGWVNWSRPQAAPAGVDRVVAHQQTGSGTPAATARPGQRALVVYPAPPGAEPSPTYSVAVNGQPVFVARYRDIAYAHFDFAGQADVAVTVSEPVARYTISPKSFKLASTFDDRTIHFSLGVPRKLMIWEVNGLPDKLLIFADPVEDDAPQLSGDGVVNLADAGVDNTGSTDVTAALQSAVDGLPAGGTLYVPAGTYSLTRLNLKSNSTVYLAGGAALRVAAGSLPNGEVVSLRNLDNVKLLGRGEIDGNASAIPRHPEYQGVVVRNTSNCTIAGIIVRDPATSPIRFQNSNHCELRNVKALVTNVDPHQYADGIDLESSQSITLQDILVHSTDDCIAVGASQLSHPEDMHDISVVGSILFNKTTGSGFKLVSNWMGDQVINISNVTYEDVDVVQAASSPIGIFSLQGGTIENISFNNIRTEKVLDRLMALYVDTVYWQSPSWNGAYGTIRNIHVRNFEAQEYGPNHSGFLGRANRDTSGEVADVSFENLRIAGQPVTNQSDARIDFIADRTGQHVRNVSFAPAPSTVVRVVASGQYATRDPMTAGAFSIERSGSAAEPVTVSYTVRGTAVGGVDFAPLPGSVTLAAGVTSATVTVQPGATGADRGLLTVLLELAGSPGYMRGTDYQAIVIIS